jgi:serine/threonine protein kinase
MSLGLAYLHTGCNSLIIHRDVKSSNILIGAKLEGKVSDFGISRSQSREGMVDFSTMKLVGSLGYLDPE